MHRRTLVWIVVISLLSVGGLLIWAQVHSTKPVTEVTKKPSDEAHTEPQATIQEPAPSTLPASKDDLSRSVTSSSSDPLPTAKDLSVPFTPQAPTANWDAVHEEYCEEASLLMVGRYFSGRGITGAPDAEAGMAELANYETDHDIPTTSAKAEQVASVVRGEYGLTATLIQNPSANDLRRAIAGGKLLIVPAYGRALGNPHFTPPGPVYHMFVVRGYTADGQFITNDPGIKEGLKWHYRESVLMNSIGDWNNGDPEHGEKIVIAVTK